MSTEKNAKTSREFIAKYGTQISVIIAILVLSVLIHISTYIMHGQNIFFTTNNIFKVLHQISYTAIMSAGMSFIILTGNIDLSIAAILAIACSVSGDFMVNGGIPPVLGILLALVIGLLCGVISGLFITKLKLPAFITTLGLMYIYRGVASTITGGFSAQNMPTFIKWMGQGYIGPVPVSVIIMFLVFAVSWFVLSKTTFGLKVYATGGNSKAAKLSGIKTDKVILAVFCISSLLSVLGGFILAGRMNGTSAIMATGAEMDCIAAVVIGGISMSGAEGSIWGALIGSMLMGILRNGLNLLGIDSFWQQTAIGVVLILAVAIDAIRSSRKNAA